MLIANRHFYKIGLLQYASDFLLKHVLFPCWSHWKRRNFVTLQLWYLWVTLYLSEVLYFDYKRISDYYMLIIRIQQSS